MSLVNDLLEDFCRRRVLPNDNPKSPLANIEVAPRELGFENGAPFRSRSNSISMIAVGMVSMACGAAIALAAMLQLGPALEVDAMPDVSARPPAAVDGIYDSSGFGGFSGQGSLDNSSNDTNVTKVTKVTKVEELSLDSIAVAGPEASGASGSDWGTITQTRPRAGTDTALAHRSLDRARDLVAQDRAREAIAEYLRALSFEPGLHRARESLVGLLIESGQLSAAQRQLAVGIATAPAHAEFTLLRAQLLAAMKQPDLAIAILESLPLPPDRRSDSLNLLAALYQEKGNHSRAETLFRNAVGLAPYEARLWMGLGISLEGQDRGDEALVVYKQAESLADFETGPRRWLRSRIRELSSVE